MKSEKCDAFDLIRIFVSVVLLVQVSCQTNYQVGFENVHGSVNNHSGNATHNYTVPIYGPNYIQTTLHPVIHHPVTHKTTTHRTTHSTTHRTTTLLPIILQTGYSDTPPAILYKNSPVFKSSVAYQLSPDTKSKFENFLRKHIENMREKANHLREPIIPSRDYYFVAHNYYNKGLVSKFAITNRTFGECQDKNTSNIVCLPNSHAICAENGMIMCVTLLQQTSPCQRYSDYYCVDVTLPCTTDDVPCIASRQLYRTVPVPCLTVRTVSNNNLIARYTIPENPFDMDPNALCITIIVEPKLFRSPVGSLARLGFHLGKAHMDLIPKVTTYKPASVGVTNPPIVANQTQHQG